MSTLFELTQVGEVLLGIIEECGEDAEKERMAIRSFFELENAIEEKLDAYAAVIKELEARAAARNAEALRLSSRGRSDHNQAVRMLETLKWHLQERGIRKAETRRFTISIVKNGGKLSLRFDVPPEELPNGYTVTKTVIEPDTDAIRKELEAGHEVPGCHLSERGERVSIR